MSDSIQLPESDSSPGFGSTTRGGGKSLREELNLRPACLALIALAAGLAAAFAWWHVLLVVPLLAWLRFRRSTIILVVFAVVGVVIRPHPDARLVDDSRPFSGQIEIVSMPRVSEFGLQSEGISGGDKYVIRGRANLDLSMGDVIQANGIIEPLKETQEPARGAVAVIQLVGRVTHVKHGLIIWRWGRQIQQSFSRFVSEHFSKDDAGMLDALCFSANNDLDPTMRLNIRRSGLSHIVSASGLQVTIAAVALFWLFIRLPIDRRWQLVLLIFVLLLYAGAAGLRASIVRAIIMGAVGLGSWLFKREPDGLSAVGIAGTLNLLADPESIADLGFLLSYSAMLGLILFAPLREGNGRRSWKAVAVKGKELVVGSAIAGFVTTPLVALVFGEVAVAGMLANVLVLPFVTLATIFSLVGWMIGLIFPDLGAAVINATTIPFIRWFELVANTIGPWPASSTPVPAFSPYVVLLFWVVLMMMWRPRLREA